MKTKEDRSHRKLLYTHGCQINNRMRGIMALPLLIGSCVVRHIKPQGFDDAMSHLEQAGLIDIVMGNDETTFKLRSMERYCYE